MLDIKLIRENPQPFREDLKKRGWDQQLIDTLLQWDKIWRDSQSKINKERANKNKIAAGYGKLMGSYKKFDNLAKNLESSAIEANDYLKYRENPPALINFFYGNRKRIDFFVSIKNICQSIENFEDTINAYKEAYRQFMALIDGEKANELAIKNELVLQQLKDKIGEACHLRELADDYSKIQKMPDELTDKYVKQVLSHPLWPVDDIWSLIEEIRNLHAGPRDIASDASERVKALEQTITKSEKARVKILKSLPNVTHSSVPIGRDDADNVPIRHWPDDQPRARPNGISHVDLLDSLDVADLERAARAAGSRFAYLKGDLVMLAKALEFFALRKLQERGFTPVDPPYLLRREAIEGAVDLADFEDVIYKVEAGAGADKGDAPELYLIATSEHPLAAMHMGEILEKKDLPLCYAGVSPCFRKEAGSHGKDTRGIFRVHQFSKVEQFVYCDPEESWDWHERLIANAEEIYRELGIPHRVVNICTGDLGTVAAKKYDIEAWMPVQGAYREVVSCSNCTDYQARRYNTRTWDAPGQPTRVLHTLNSTAVAVQRTLVAILENFQQPDGSVVVPEVLRPWVGRDRIEPAA